jgi:hypothetical protein
MRNMLFFLLMLVVIALLVLLVPPLAVGQQTTTPNLSLQIPYNEELNWGPILGADLTSIDSVIGGTQAAKWSALTLTPVVIKNATTSATLLTLDLSGDLTIPGTGTFGGPVVLPGNPTLALQATTKQYVDSSVGTAVSVASGAAATAASAVTTANSASAAATAAQTAATTAQNTGTAAQTTATAAQSAAAAAQSTANSATTAAAAAQSTATAAATAAANAVTTSVQAANNGSDFASIAQVRTNLGLGPAATVSSAMINFNGVFCSLAGTCNPAIAGDVSGTLSAAVVTKLNGVPFGPAATATSSSITINTQTCTLASACTIPVFSLGGTLSASNVTLGSGVGSGGSLGTVVGTDGNHSVTFTTGPSGAGGPLASAPLFTITFTASRGHTTYCLAQFSNYAGITSLGQLLSMGTANSTEYTVSSGTTGLAPSTSYTITSLCP